MGGYHSYSLTYPISFNSNNPYLYVLIIRTYHVRSKFSYDKSKKEIKHTKVTEESELNSLRTLLASDISSLTSTSPATNHSLYQIRTLSNPQDSNSPYIYAAIPACDLQRSGYKEKIVLHFDYKNSIIGKIRPLSYLNLITHLLILLFRVRIQRSNYSKTS